jgi:parvulin-like peptidyl-prolyl isomerase
MKKCYCVMPLVMAALVLATWFSGCGKSDTQVVAKVGNYDIKLKEFNEIAKNLNARYASAQEEFDAKYRFLDSVVVPQRLLIQAAYDRGLDKAEEVTSVVAQNGDKFLLDVLYAKEIESKVSVKEADVKDFYNRIENRAHAAHIVVATLDTAQMLAKKLADGASFEQLAFDYSIDPNAKRSKGDLGFVTWGDMASLPEFEDVLFKLQPGEVSSPVQTRFGYHLIKMVEKQPNAARKSFEEMRPTLEKKLGDIMRQRAAVLYVTAIQKSYPVTVDKSTCEYLKKKRESLYPPDLLKTLPKSDFDDAQLDRPEKELVLATWEGGQINVGDYLAAARQLPQQIRPSLDNPDSLAIVIFQIKLTDILTFEAKKKGLDSDPSFKDKIGLFKELTMAEAMKNDSSLKAGEPTEDAVRKYFDNNQQSFIEPARIHVYEIQLNDEIQAGKLAKQIKSLAEFKDKASQLTERADRRASGGDMGYIIRNWFPEIFDLAWKLPVGSIGGPVVSGGKYSIFYLVDKIDQRATDFLAVKPQLTVQLQRDATTAKFEEWVKDRRAAAKVTINNDVLWTTVDKTKYATADTTAAKKN